MKVGVAGIGRMGAAIAERLLLQGHAVTVWNRTQTKAQALARHGASVADTPAQLATSADIILSILTDATAIAATYDGPAGLLSADVKGKLFVEMSTVRPATQQALAARVQARGAAMIDCPVGGTTGPAREGKLLGFVGGDVSDLNRARPILEQLCRRIEHVGPVGAGVSLKLAINLPLLVYWQAFGEALALCQPLGLDTARVVNIFADTSGGPNVLKSRGPTIAEALGGKVPADVTFNIDSIRKDLTTMIEEAQTLGYDLPLAARALECYDTASRAGLGDGDAVMLPVSWLKRRQ
ncbi:MAG: NAD(P)-dependent oxidoreductase [Betaproteobacteria bacterium]|nr:MAG: NAD(P)-dependent oxidoreductase [Betaproteobacteria bacterium]